MVSEWISVEDRLPELREEVLFYSITGVVYIGWLSIFDDNFHVNDWCADDHRFENITHWQPLPEPPNESNPDRN